MEKLVADGRIHPTRIEEIVAACEKQMEGFIRQKLPVNIQGLRRSYTRHAGAITLPDQLLPKCFAT